MRRMGDGGSVEEQVVPTLKVTQAQMAEGTWVVEETGAVVLAWDNSFSMLRSKSLAYTAR
jgi:hypothetical protein